MHKSEAAIYINKGSKIILDEISFTNPGPDEVIVQNIYSGLCGSILTNLSRQPSNPELLGHEGTGLIIDKGKKVKHVKIGDTVLISWMPYHNNEGNEYLKFTDFYYKKKKFKTLLYTLSKKSKLNSQFVSKLPTNIDLNHSSIIGCAVISGYLPLIKNENIKKDSTIAIYGMGGLGLLAVNAARRIGLKNICCIDISKKKLQFSKKFGSKYLINYNDKVFEKKINHITKKKGFDFIYDFVGNKKIQENAINNLKKCVPGYSRGGTLGIVGFHYENLSISAKQILMNEITLQGLRGGSAIMKEDLVQIYKDIRSKKLKIDKVVTETFDLKEINKAISKLRKGEILGRASVKI
jgi:Zn-dependent alcohol dehydrogenase